jgi:5-methylcytosine-specific restriction endonuclease McrA
MAKLTALKPSLGNIAPRLGYASGDEKAQDKSRNQLAPWRAWYKTTRWTKLRQTILLRDLYTCAMCGRIASTGMVVDHIKPHRGSAALFWSEANLQVLCGSPCHSKHKQQQERAIAAL